MKTTKITLLASIALLILGISGAYCQTGYREKDPDSYKFVGAWKYESADTTFYINFGPDYLRLGRNEDGSPIGMEVLMGRWQLKIAQQEINHTQRYAVVARTIQNPNVLEGSIWDDSYGVEYYFTMELVDTDKVRWRITRSRKLSNPEEGAVLLAPPTECILTRVPPAGAGHIHEPSHELPNPGVLP